VTRCDPPPTFLKTAIINYKHSGFSAKYGQKLFRSDSPFGCGKIAASKNPSALAICGCNRERLFTMLAKQLLIQSDH
jgi:hypothetical protein